MEQKKSKYGLMNDGSIEAFDGVSLIQWTEDHVRYKSGERIKH